MPAESRVDGQILSTLYHDEADGMRRLAYLLVTDRAIADEIVQEAFARLVDRVDGLERPGAYLRTVVVNLARGQLRRWETERCHPPPTPEVELPRELDETWDALSQLTERERTALVLRFYRDLPVADVAEAMACPLGTAKSLIHRGLGRLKEVLEP